MSSLVEVRIKLSELSKSNEGNREEGSSGALAEVQGRAGRKGGGGKEKENQVSMRQLTLGEEHE